MDTFKSDFFKYLLSVQDNEKTNFINLEKIQNFNNVMDKKNFDD